ncbi:MAG: inositol monophosphatase [Phycisphaerales bacterium]|nr:MAG: inositol monophosphatase [Phycisphaerales bacterium]
MTDRALDEYARLAMSMADEAAQTACYWFGRATASRKADGSDVTNADICIQEMMVERIRGAYGDHLIVGEETGVVGGSPADALRAEYCWVTDPLDGTRNFARAVPVFSTAITLLERGRPVVGVVQSLTTGDTYLATRGRGATHNGRALTANPQPCDERSMLAVQSTIRDGDRRILDSFAGTAVLRNLGSTALHLALVAAGGFCGAVGWECKLWDVAAGWLLVEEAGGLCTDWVGQSLIPFSAEAFAGRDVPFVAAGRQAHTQLLSRLARAGDPPPRTPPGS